MAQTASQTPRPTITRTPSPVPRTAASATVTAIATGSASASPTGTTTATPTMIATTPAATATPPPTFVPATPDAQTSYRLRPWTTEMAQQLVARMEAYPDSLPAAARGYNNASYYDAYRYAVLLQREGLFRSGEAGLAAHWQWDLAYNYVRLGDARASALYANLLAAALNENETVPMTVPSWFGDRESRLTVELDEIAPLRQHQTAYLVTLDAGSSGSHLWLVRDLGGFHVYPLQGGSDFDLAHGAGFSAGLADVTGDGLEDLVRVNGHQPGSSRALYYTEIILYSLAEAPPRRLFLQPPPATHLGWGEEDGWRVIRGEQAEPLFRLRAQPTDRCASVQIVTDYAWNGEFLQLADTHYAIGDRQGDSSRFCLPYVFTAAATGSREAVRFLEKRLEDDLLPETVDEWRYRIGLYEALSGNYEQATLYLTDVISNPAGTDRSWVRASQRFRDAYSDPSRLYAACAAAELCDERLAMRRLATSIPRAAFAVAAEQLRDWAVPLVRHGFFDVDDDGESEQWLLVREGLELGAWLLARTTSGIDAIFLDTVARNDPFDLERLEGINDRFLLRISTRSDPLLFSLYRTPPPGSSLVITKLRSQSDQESSNYTPQLLRESQEALFSGENAVLLLAALQAFRNSDGFACTSGSFEIDCAEYQYTIAVAHELAGNERDAAAAFVRLWQEYPDSPLVAVARARLEAVPTPTPTFTPTATPSSTPTATPTTTPTTTGTMELSPTVEP